MNIRISTACPRSVTGTIIRSYIWKLFLENVLHLLPSMVNRDSKVIAKFVRIFTSIFDRKKKWILKVIGTGNYWPHSTDYRDRTTIQSAGISNPTRSINASVTQQASSTGTVKTWFGDITCVFYHSATVIRSDVNVAARLSYHEAGWSHHSTVATIQEEKDKVYTENTMNNNSSKVLVPLWVLLLKDSWKKCIIAIAAKARSHANEVIAEIVWYSHVMIYFQIFVVSP